MTTARPLRTIGELARRTGVPVRTIRFYSDGGLVPPAARSDAGYRLYDDAALGRLELVRSLRELGVDLATTRRVLARELTLAEVAAAHAAALDAQIRILRLRRGVLALVAKRESRLAEAAEQQSGLGVAPERAPPPAARLTGTAPRPAAGRAAR